MLRNVIAAVLFPVLIGSPVSAAPRGFVGDTGSGWDTTSAVSARAGSEHSGASRLAVNAINGAGIDGTGDTHNNVPNDMWLSLDPAGPDRFGVSPGGHWIEFAFDQSHELNEMWIWNYAEGQSTGYAWSAMGLKNSRIEYTTVDGPVGWGSTNPADWTEIFAGDFDVYDPGQARTHNIEVDFGGIFAKYVLITTTTDSMDINWICEKISASCGNDDAGLSEVRFYAAPAPISHTVINATDATVVEFPSAAGNTYRLQKSPSVTMPTWTDAGLRLIGTGSAMQFNDMIGAAQAQIYRLTVE
jgi:hypothetical protein